MANPEHVEIVNRGTKAIDKWRTRIPDRGMDLFRAHVTDGTLDRATKTTPQEVRIHHHAKKPSETPHGKRAWAIVSAIRVHDRSRKRRDP